MKDITKNDNLKFEGIFPIIFTGLQKQTIVEIFLLISLVIKLSSFFSSQVLFLKLLDISFRNVYRAQDNVLHPIHSKPAKKEFYAHLPCL